MSRNRALRTPASGLEAPPAGAKPFQFDRSAELAVGIARVTRAREPLEPRPDSERPGAIRPARLELEAREVVVEEHGRVALVVAQPLDASTERGAPVADERQLRVGAQLAVAEAVLTRRGRVKRVAAGGRVAPPPPPGRRRRAP